jgi:hypothetical protein
LLPTLHARAVRLSDDGLAAAELGERLGIDPTESRALLRVGRTMLATLEALPDPTVG